MNVLEMFKTLSEDELADAITEVAFRKPLLYNDGIGRGYEYNAINAMFDIDCNDVCEGCDHCWGKISIDDYGYDKEWYCELPLDVDCIRVSEKKKMYKKKLMEWLNSEI